jgi:hypothetical protein
MANHKTILDTLLASIGEAGIRTGTRMVGFGHIHYYFIWNIFRVDVFTALASERASTYLII